MVKKRQNKENNEVLGIQYRGQKLLCKLEENSKKNPANQDVLSPAKLAGKLKKISKSKIYKDGHRGW